MVNDKVEILEFEAGEKSKVINKALKDLKLKENVLIAGITRNNEYILPTGSTIIEKNDSVIVVTTNTILNDLDNILA